MEQNFIDLLLKGCSDDSNLQLPSPSLVQYYEDVSNRVVWIDGEINDDLFPTVSQILRWNRQDRSLPVEGRKPVKIFFNSPGGDLDTAETLVSIIKLSKTPIYGFALGMVASAASLIYLSCHRRFILPNGYFIFHRGSCSNVGGSYNEIQAAMEDYRAQIEKMEKFYIENTTYPEEIIKEKIQTDWYIHTDEALKYNIATDLIEDISILL